MAALALLLSAGSLFLSALLFTRLADTTTRTNDALCNLRIDVRQRVAGAEAFLKDHPDGIPGIPVATLRQSLDGQRRTVAALSTLNCPPPNPLAGG